MRKQLLIAFCILPTVPSFSQDTVTVVEKSIKIPALSPLTEYYGFADGDKVIFNIWVEKGKELKDLTISEYPNTVRFAEHTVEKFENKVLQVSRNGIYRIDYNNSNIMPRIVNIRIQRIPKDASTRSFNTGVKWVARVDTSIRSQETDYQLKSDTSYHIMLDTVIKINAKTSADNLHRTLISFNLPANTLRWVYWIGAGETAIKTFELDKQRFSDKQVQAGSPDLLRGVAMGLTSMTQIKVGENIRYFFISKLEETKKFLVGAGFGQFRQGEMVTDYGVMNYPNKNPQQYYIGFSNDNPAQPVSVVVKILAVVVVKGYEAKGENIAVYSTSTVPVHEQ